MSINNISLYIPHVFANYTKEDVAQVFDEFSIGDVKNIDFVEKMGHDGKAFNAAYVHFHEWYSNPNAAAFQEKVMNPNKEARLVYDKPWYWIVLENKVRKIAPGERKPRIDLSDMEKPAEKPAEKPVTVFVPRQAMKKKVVPKESDIHILDTTCITEEELAEIAEIMDEEDKHIVCVDGRYLRAMEEENETLRASVLFYQNAMCVEQIKTQTLMDTLIKMK
jgi:hypothetical protein